MARPVMDPSRAPVAFGQRAVPQLFEQLQQPQSDTRQRVLTSLCDLIHEPERLYQTVNGGFLGQLKDLLMDEDPSVRAKTCELLHLLTAHSTGRQALLSSSLLPPLSQLLDDSSISCRRNVHRVLNRLSLLPAGAEALLTLVPKLLLKLSEEEEDDEEVQVLLLSTLSRCSRLDTLPALASDGVSLLGQKLSHRSPNIRREAAAVLMALSVPEEGKLQVCDEALLPVLIGLLQDKDVEVQANAAGVIMYTVIITRACEIVGQVFVVTETLKVTCESPPAGKQQCLDLDVIPILLHMVTKNEEEEDAKERKALIMYSLQALTSLAEVPKGRSLLLPRLPLLTRRSEAAEEDRDIRKAAQTAVSVTSSAIPLKYKPHSSSDPDPEVCMVEVRFDGFVWKLCWKQTNCDQMWFRTASPYSEQCGPDQLLESVNARC
ncbi:Radial spoke head 14 -like protein [Channa argus]|uniref:Radial spoke head 14-like protein n=1 Tax=Channa argus TaxID=215402 RepID=A0A6G1PYR8_CHAAH|nr:Radial spoke head 14 -like protein [Channa argus]